MPPEEHSRSPPTEAQRKCKGRGDKPVKMGDTTLKTGKEEEICQKSKAQRFSQKSICTEKNHSLALNTYWGETQLVV
jgi:hypothetical protein